MKHLQSLLLLAVVITHSCISGHTERAADVDPTGWSPGDTVWVAVDNRDTVSLREISVLLRVDSRYGENSLDLNLCVISPDSAVFREPLTLTTPLKCLSGSAIAEYTVPYRVASTLSASGEYRFGFSPEKRYKGVTAIGIKTDR